MRLFAQPFGTFSPHEAVTQLQQLHAREGIAIVVVGWPLTEDGKEGKATQRVQQYINRLRNALAGVEVTKWDERYTSEMAKAQLSGGIRRRKHPAEKGRVDAAAAGIMLQEYLDQ